MEWEKHSDKSEKERVGGGEGTGQTDRQKGGIEIDREKERKRIAS